MKIDIKYKNLRTKILFLLTITTLVLLACIETYHYYDKREILYKISTEKLLVLTKTIKNFEKKQFQLFKSRIDMIQNNSNIIKAIADLNIEKVSLEINSIKDYYKKATSNLEHIHIYNTAKEEITNMHQCDYNHTQLQENIVLNQAIKTKKFTIGYVIQKADEYYYSIISPLKYKEKIIAYIEFGLKADNLFKIASKAGRYKYALYLKDTNSNGAKRKLGNLVVSNSKIFKELKLNQEYIYKTANTNTIVEYKNRYYLLQQYDLETNFQKDFAQVIMASNVTTYVEENRQTILMVSIIAISLLFLMIIILYLVFTKLINKLIEDEEQLKRKSNQIQAVLDYSENFVIFFENNELILVNNSFLSFLDCKNMNTFLKQYTNLSTVFIEDSNTISFTKSDSNLQWIREVYALEENDRVVAIKHATSGLHYFNVKITRIANQSDSNIVIFSDITALYRESKEYEYKSNHDELTGIYNRHYFDTIIAEAVQNNKSMSLLMLDLDFFKRVNDTYGHQTGDEILIKFTKVVSHHIRANDLFARWGGEEFVILIFNQSDTNVRKIAETLRQNIEETDFNLDDNLTCSIGVSRYKDNEKFRTFLKRVDKALYTAKDNGRNQVTVI